MTEEYLDIVNENNKVIGQEKRHIVHTSGLWHRGVHVFLFSPGRKLLVQRRSRTQDTFPNALDCSVSEHLKVGEPYLEGAARGLREELGIKGVRLIRLLRLKMAYGPADNMINELYEGVCEGQALTIDHHEIAHTAYHSLPKLEEMMASGQLPFSSWFEQLLRWYVGKPARLQVMWSRRDLPTSS